MSRLTKRRFNAILTTCTTRRRLDVDKVAQLSPAERLAAALLIIRNRHPLVKAFAVDILAEQPLDKNLNRAWLASMGYLYETRSPSTGIVFLHTGEHQIR